MVPAIFLVALLLTHAAAVHNAMLHGLLGIPKISGPQRTFTNPDGSALPSITTIYYFDQLIDHNNPSLGTFQQRYWMSWEFYQYGGPIILMTAESNAEGYESYLTNATINGMIAQQQQGATILIEHRFFGFSNPYPNLTSQSLEFLTIQQAIDDLVYFAQTVNLPIPGGDNVKPDTTQWVLVGGGYAGALTSWTMVNQPGIFYAGYASSAVVQPIIDFYGYFTPIQEYMPQNCSSDVQAVIAYLDQNYADNNVAALQNLKESFGLGRLSHIDDFAAALQFNLFDWQFLRLDVGPGAMFFKFCDALEVKDGVSAPATGWGLGHAIDSWGSFWKNTYYASLCGGTDAESCLGTYSPSLPYWTDVTVNNRDRSWSWIVCNQFGGYMDGPPLGQPAITSRILRPVYSERQCAYRFPEKFSYPPSPCVSAVIGKFKGWDVSVDRLFFANSLRSPWREMTVSADGLNKSNTSMQPIYESDTFHCSDMFAWYGSLDDTVYAVQQAALVYMKTWLVS